MTWPRGDLDTSFSSPASWASRPFPATAYAATKAYVLAFGEALHDELRPHGIVVTSLCPGHTATGFDAAAGATASPVLRLLTMKPRPVAASGIAALSKGRAMVVAGLANKMVALSNRLTPRSMQRATMRKIHRAVEVRIPMIFDAPEMGLDR